jgi:hypothetical protein
MDTKLALKKEKKEGWSKIGSFLKTMKSSWAW